MSALRCLVGAAVLSTALAIYGTKVDCKTIDVTGKWCSDCNVGWVLVRNRDSATGELLDIGACQRIVTGKCTGNCESGFGRFAFDSGNVYEGYWKPDPAGKDAVVEERSMGSIQHGQGKYTWADGTVYDGEWKDGKQHGQGKYTWADGDVYDGEWKDGKMHGQGKQTIGTSVYHNGEWRNDKPFGKSHPEL